jgi:MFS family permease
MAQASTAPGAIEEPIWPSKAAAGWSLTVLTLGVAVGTIDRSVISLLVEPIKRDFAMTDTQFSLVTGFAFVFFYAIVGLPVSRLADVYSRRLIIACSMLFWGTATMSCGLAQTYSQLFWARVGVGAGESAFSPATYSVVTDSFRPSKLPAAMAMLGIGFTLGTAFANFVGGGMVHLLAGTGGFDLPLVGHIRSWQIVFLVTGLPALLLALLMATVHEPTRKGYRDPTVRARRRAVPIKDVARYLGHEWRVFVPIFTVLAVNVIVSFGMTLWVPALFTRTFGWTIGQIAFALGLTALIASPAGLWSGVRLAAWLSARGCRDANLRVLAIATSATAPFTISFALAPSGGMALGLFAASQFLYYLGQAPNNAALQIIVPNEMRGQVRALYQFIFNVVGYGLGPLIIALFTDKLFHGDQYLRYSIALMATCLTPFAIIAVWLGLRPYADALQRSRAWS